MRVLHLPELHAVHDLKMPFQNFSLLNKDITLLTSSSRYVPHEATPSCFAFVAETGIISSLLWYADHVIERPPKDFHLPVIICANFFLFLLSQQILL